MSRQSDKSEDPKKLREKIIGLGERSARKSYYPKLQEQIEELERIQEQLKQVTRRYELILESAGEGIFGLDLKGNYTFMNKAAAAMLGFDREEVIGKHSHSCIHFMKQDGSAYPESECRTYAAFRDGIARHVDDECFCRKDGSQFPVEYTSMPIRENGEIAGAVVTFNDITERKRAEEALRTSEANFRAIFDSANDAIFVHDIDTGKVISVNRKTTELFGRPLEELADFSNENIFSGVEGYRAKDALHWIKRAAEGTPQIFEWLSKKKNGELFWLEVNLKRTLIGGEPRLLAVARDITDRKRAEETLKQLSRRYELLLTSAGEGIVGLDGRGGVTFINRAAASMLGYKEEEVIGKNSHATWHYRKPDGTVYPLEECPLYAAYIDGSVHSGEEVFIRKDGVAFPVDFNSLPLKEDGIVGSVVTFRDITERKKAEEALKLTQFSVDHASVSAFLVNRQGRFLYMNEQAYRTLGYSRDELSSLAVYDIDPNFPKSQWDRHWSDLKREGSLHFETFHRKKDGTFVPVEVSANFVSFGGREYNWGFARDISERKKVEDEVARLNRQKELILESAGDGIFGMDLNGNHTLTNSAGARMLGYRPEELMGRYSHSLWHHTRADGTPYPSDECLIYKTRQDGISRHVDDEVFWKKDGSSIPVEYVTTPIREGNAITGAVVSFRDITERKRAEEALRLSESRFRGLFKQSSISMQIFSPDGRTLEVNHAFEELWKVKFDSLKDYNIFTDVQLDAKGIMPYIRKGFAGEATEIPITHYDPSETDLSGRARSVKAFIYPIKTSAGRIHQVVLMHWDVTEMVEAQEALKESEERFRAFFESAGVGTVQLDPATRKFLRTNERFCRLTGYDCEELKSMTFHELTHPEDRVVDAERFAETLRPGAPPYETEKRYIRKDGEVVWVHVSATVVRDAQGKPVHTAGIVQDITDRKRMEEEIRHLAHHDSLTGLPNRRLFNEIITVETAQAQRDGTKIAVLFLDLDRFKEINDTLGHEAGDALLKEVASRLKALLRKSDRIGRIGGDEFNIILADITRPEDVSDIARKIVDSFRRPFWVAGQELHVTTSLGISIFPDDSTDIDTLLRYSDMAMYHAKESGRNTYRFYNSSINIRSIERMKLENMLRKSMKLGEMVMYYQPQVDIATGKIVCAEALLRWRHPEKGLLLPNDFIPAAQQAGFITEIDEWVLRAVCGQLSAWLQADLPPFCVTVNLSARQFQNPELVFKLKSILEETGVPADRLDIEIPESMAMGDVERSAAVMRKLSDMGVHISIDDFGTGYSSLSYLKKMPIEKLKIDQSFVREISVDRDDREIINAVTAMAHNMNMKVIAEGVECEDQLTFLNKIGCDEAQGFLFSEPLPAEKFQELLKAA